MWVRACEWLCKSCLLHFAPNNLRLEIGSFRSRLTLVFRVYVASYFYIRIWKRKSHTIYHIMNQNFRTNILWHFNIFLLCHSMCSDVCRACAANRVKNAFEICITKCYRFCACRMRNYSYFFHGWHIMVNVCLHNAERGVWHIQSILRKR